MVIREISGRRFEWDENKAAINLKKHKVRFESAAKVFQDENKMTQRDEKHSIEEDRWITIGKVRGVLVVVHTQREENIRIITARKANKAEEAKYYGNRALFSS